MPAVEGGKRAIKLLLELHKKSFSFESLFAVGRRRKFLRAKFSSSSSSFFELHHGT